MDRFMIYLRVLSMYTNEKNNKKKKELVNDLEALKNGFIPVKYFKYL